MAHSQTSTELLNHCPPSPSRKRGENMGGKQQEWESLQIQTGKSFSNYCCGKTRFNLLSITQFWLVEAKETDNKATSFLPTFPGSASLLHSQLPYPVQAPWRGIKVGQYRGVPLFPPHGFPLLQGRLSTGCSFIGHIHLIWLCSLWAAAWISAPEWSFSSSADLGVPSAASHSFCFLLSLSAFSCLSSHALPWRYHQLC